MIVAAKYGKVFLGATGLYIPNCAGTYNPCAEIEKARLANVNPNATLVEKCRIYGTACYPGSAGYIPDCGGGYDPTAEVDKVYSVGLEPSPSLLAKAALWVKTCGNSAAVTAPATAPVAKAGITAAISSLQSRSVSPSVGSRTGLTSLTQISDQPAGVQAQEQQDTWGDAYINGNNYQPQPQPEAVPKSWLSANKGTVGIGLAVVVGGLILWKLL